MSPHCHTLSICNGAPISTGPRAELTRVGGREVVMGIALDVRPRPGMPVMGIAIDIDPEGSCRMQTDKNTPAPQRVHGARV